MAKDFKDKSAADKFFNTMDTKDTKGTQGKKKKAAPPPEHYRVNLKLRPQYKEYLQEAAWYDRKSITEFINDLIEADKIKRQGEDEA